MVRIIAQNRVLSYFQKFQNWNIHGDSFFLSISGTVYIESVMPVNLGDTWSPDHMEVFWMNEFQM